MNAKRKKLEWFEKLDKYPKSKEEMFELIDKAKPGLLKLN